MTWTQFSRGFRLDPIAKGSPEALVVLLHDLGAGAATLTLVAAPWAAAVPATAFVALDEPPQRDPASPASAPRDVAAGADATALDRASRHLAPLLDHQLRSRRLDASRLVLVGFGYGGTLALHMVLRHGRSCAGVLAFAAKLVRPLPRIARADHKVRLIACAGDGCIDHGGLRDVVTSLTARGIDARGVSLAGSMLSDEVIRHGGSYLVELVATAQRHRVPRPTLRVGSGQRAFRQNRDVRSNRSQSSRPAAG
jgi:predicted esterase